MPRWQVIPRSRRAPQRYRMRGWAHGPSRILLQIMVWRYTLAVVPQHFDHAAIADGTSFTLYDHTLQFRIQGVQLGDAAFACRNLRAGDGIGGGAGLLGPVGQAQEVADGIKREPNLPRVAYERQRIQRHPSAKPLVSRTAIRFGQDADLIVIADRSSAP